MGLASSHIYEQSRNQIWTTGKVGNRPWDGTGDGMGQEMGKGTELRRGMERKQEQNGNRNRNRNGNGKIIKKTVTRVETRWFESLGETCICE